VREHLFRRGESAFLFLREDELAVHAHFEHAAATTRERRVDAALLLDLGRQTGGPGQIASLPAVKDLDRHLVPPEGIAAVLITGCTEPVSGCT
jgi:hypothetical protein